MASTKVAQTKTSQMKEAQMKEAQRSQEKPEAPAEEQVETHHPHTATIRLPFVTVEFRAPDIHLPSVPMSIPDRHDLSGAVSSIRSRLPSPEQAAYYVGLGLLGVLEIIEWPVAVAIGVGTAIAHRQSTATRTEPELEEASAEPSGRH